jgi:hypothetical protein
MKHYTLINTEGVHEYDMIVDKLRDGTMYTLKRSKNELWSNPGEVIMEVSDDGDNIRFDKKISRTMNYCDFAELYIMMAFIKNYDTEMIQGYSVYETSKAITL